MQRNDGIACDGIACVCVSEGLAASHRYKLDEWGVLFFVGWRCCGVRRCWLVRLRRRPGV